MIANTGRRRRDPRRARLPRPRPRHLLARRPHRRARLGPRRRHASRVMDALRELGRDVWFNLGDRDLALVPAPRASGCARARALTEALRRAVRRRSACAARVLPMCDAPGAHARARRAALVAVPGVHDPRRGADGPVEGVEFAARSRRRADARGARRDRRAPSAIVIGPSNPVISIGPILAVPGHAPRRCARRARPVVAVSPVRRRRGRSRARPSAFMALGRPSSCAPPGVAARLRRRCSTASSPTSTLDRACPPLLRPTR